jgi:DMSO/TMAO reductase YedYZ molybdopterin-dependent catalytic subunit
VRVAEILARCEPLPEARYLEFTSYGLAQHSYRGKPLDPFYEVIDPILASHQQTILAYEFNDAPLPARHGTPQRLRVGTQVG